MNSTINATRSGAFYRWKVVLCSGDTSDESLLLVWPVSQTKEGAEKRAIEIYPKWKVKFSSKLEPVYGYKGTK